MRPHAKVRPHPPELPQIPPTRIYEQRRPIPRASEDQCRPYGCGGAQVLRGKYISRRVSASSPAGPRLCDSFPPPHKVCNCRNGGAHIQLKGAARPATIPRGLNKLDGTPFSNWQGSRIPHPGLGGGTMRPGSPEKNGGCHGLVPTASEAARSRSGYPAPGFGEGPLLAPSPSLR